MNRILILFLFSSLLFIKNSNATDNDTLIAANAVWKYRDNGANLGTAWTLPSYNDSLWLSGPAELGYNDGDEATVVSYGPDPNNKYITTYFRNTFSVSNDSIYKSLRIKLKRDDGAVVYLNGIEVFRSNMPYDTIDYVTHAVSGINSIEEITPVISAISIAPLQSGNNVLAVEVHQNFQDGSDMSFELSLIADTSAEIVRGPYLQMATPNSMTVCWRTSCLDISKVLYGTSLSYSDSLTDTTLLADHVLNIAGLLPSTKYYYAVCSSSKIIFADSNTYFITAPSSVQPVRIWAMGDMGTGSIQQLQTRDSYYNYADSTYTNIVLLLGDNAYLNGRDDEYSTQIFTNHYEDMLKKSVVYSTCGNHEYLTANAHDQTGPYYDIFTFPQNGEGGGYPSGSEAFYSFNYSNIHFVCLESNIDSFGIANTDTMVDWLENDLAANHQLWTIAYYHFPPYSRGYHDSDVDTNEIYCRQVLNPILEKYNVDLVLGGHSHDYERTQLLKGHFGLSTTLDTTMIVDSGGGFPSFYDKRVGQDSGTVYAVVGCASEVTPIQPTWPHPAMYKAFDTTYGTMVIDVNQDTMDVKFLTSTDSIDDHFVFLKSLPVVQEDTVIMRGPYLQSATPNSMNVCWRSSINEISNVYYGTTTSFTDSLIDTNSVKNHIVKISNLSPATKYFYSIHLSNGTTIGDSETFFFTPPIEGSMQPLRIWTMGDFGTGSIQQNQTRDAYYNYSGNTYTNILLWLGNNAGSLGGDDQYTANVFSGHYEDILKKSEVYSTCGNSELLHANAFTQSGDYYNIFKFPKNGEAGGYPSGSEAYYSFNYGNVHFVCLESNIDSFGTVNFNNMINWLYSDLSDNQQPWIIAYFHFPPYSKGVYDSDVNSTMTSVRANLIPVLEFFNVDLVLGSHSHDYERSKLIKGHTGLSSTFLSPINDIDSGSGSPPFIYDKTSVSKKGTVYAVVGSAGEISPVQPDWPHPAMYKSLENIYGSMVIDINRDTMDVKFITSTDSIADHFRILRDITITNTQILNSNPQQLLLLPDPVHSELSIRYMQTADEVISIYIIDNLGKVLKSWKEKPGAYFQMKIDVSNFTPGMYFVKVQSKKNNVTERFIKE